MEQDELREVIQLVNDEIVAAVHWQRTLVGIKEELEANLSRPFEQDLIYAEHFGTRPAAPKEFQLRGVTITTQVLHQTGVGLRDIKGADLLYEIVGEKYVLVQMKLEDRNRKRVTNDRAQLDDLLNNCPSVCMYKSKPPTRVPVRLNGFCGCWYRVDALDGVHIVHACEAKLIFSGRGSASSNAFASGIPKDSFMGLFASCRIGAITKVQESEQYVSELLQQEHIIFEAKQEGRFSTR